MRKEIKALVLPLVVVILVAVSLHSYDKKDPVILFNAPIVKRANPYFMPLPDNPRCASLYNNGSWTDTAVSTVPHCSPKYASCSLSAVRRWQWQSPAIDCGAHIYTQPDARTLLKGKWIAFVGDSISRNLCISFLKLLGADSKDLVFNRHSDRMTTLSHETDLPTTVSFHWQPFPENVSTLFTSWIEQDEDHRKKIPDIIITTATLWHLLHIGDAARFETDLQDMDTVALRISELSMQLSSHEVMFVLGTGTEIHVEYLKTPEKKVAMTHEQVDRYNKAMYASKIFKPNGVFGMLDLFAVTHGCGSECSVDGVHTKGEVYDAAIQILMNMIDICDDTSDCWSAHPY